MTCNAKPITSNKYDGKPRLLHPRSCVGCDQTFYIPKHRKQQFCSKSCSNTARGESVTLLCGQCSTEIVRKKSRLKNSRHNIYFCSRKCKEFAQSLKGVCVEIRPAHYGTGTGVDRYREIAFEQYPENCNRCPYNRFKSVLRVHHIDRNRNNNDPSNLEILCPTCHEEEHYLNGDGVYHNNKVVEPVGVQPTTYRLQSGCSRIEL